MIINRHTSCCYGCLLHSALFHTLKHLALARIWVRTQDSMDQGSNGAWQFLRSCFVGRGSQLRFWFVCLFFKSPPLFLSAHNDWRSISSSCHCKPLAEQVLPWARAPQPSSKYRATRGAHGAVQERKNRTCHCLALTCLQFSHFLCFQALKKGMRCNKAFLCPLKKAAKQRPWN